MENSEQGDVLRLPPRSLLIFIDETGNEDFSDPKNPTFGRGGCGSLWPEYKRRIAKPWRRLKREKLGGATKPFHATDFEQTRPTLHQITGINAFMALPFWRFAAMCDSRTELPDGIDAHKAISLVTIGYFARLARISQCAPTAQFTSGGRIPPRKLSVGPGSWRAV